MSSAGLVSSSAELGFSGGVGFFGGSVFEGCLGLGNLGLPI